MTVLDTLKGMVGLDSGANVKHFQCNNCGNEFDSAKAPKRAKCLECMERDVEVVEENVAMS
jgi:predicted Zn-ribbon and HTH transcriptional regulator